MCVRVCVFVPVSVLRQDINSWDTVSVWNMQFIFKRARVFNQNINAWRTNAVRSMNGLFDDSSAFNQDISSWQTGGVTNMQHLLYSARAFNQNLASWQTIAVKIMAQMFDDTTGLGIANKCAIAAAWGKSAAFQRTRYRSEWGLLCVPATTTALTTDDTAVATTAAGTTVTIAVAATFSTSTSRVVAAGTSTASTTFAATGTTNTVTTSTTPVTTTPTTATATTSQATATTTTTTTTATTLKSDCEYSYSTCSNNCEKGVERSITVTREATSTGTRCPVQTDVPDCQPGDGVCPTTTMTMTTSTMSTTTTTTTTTATTTTAATSTPTVLAKTAAVATASTPAASVAIDSTAAASTVADSTEAAAPATMATTIILTTAAATTTADAAAAAVTELVLAALGQNISTNLTQVFELLDLDGDGVIHGADFEVFCSSQPASDKCNTTLAVQALSLDPDAGMTEAEFVDAYSPGSQGTAGTCNMVVCAVQCQGACGWSRGRGRCMKGRQTSAAEVAERLGNCATASSSARSRSVGVATTSSVYPDASSSRGDQTIYITIGVIIAVALAGAVVWWFVRRRRRSGMARECRAKRSDTCYANPAHTLEPGGFDVKFDLPEEFDVAFDVDVDI